MDYISRKISSFLPSSSPPAASTRKRKASTLSETEVSPQQNREAVKKAIQAREARRAFTLERNANKAIHKSRVVTPHTDSAHPVTEQDIHEQLLQEQREEEGAERGLLKKQLPSTKTLSSGRRAKIQKPSGIVKALKTYPAAGSSASLVPSPSPSTMKPKTTRPTLTSATRWSTQPNSHARNLLATHGNNTKAFLRSLQEPLYAVHDAEIRDALWEMASQIQVFAKQHFSFQATDEARLRSVLPTLPKETVKIIGCVASGGPAGAKGWEELFLDSQKRQALVCAIVGNVLVEQVLQHLFFGGSKVQLEQVERMQYKLRHEDGESASAFHNVLTMVQMD
ncbi:hypothetical protein G6514_007548 [Epicoccum nigrum]|nr:hypothetical protein G6514_007548 [Epicoccum nigrum]